MVGYESIKYSLNNLRKRKSRSFFTIFSIFIGITTIFIFISFGLGLYSFIGEMSSGSSADKVLIQPKGMGVAGIGSTIVLDDTDLRAIRNTQGVYDASGVYIKPAEILMQNKRVYTLLIGYDPDKPLVMEMSNVGLYKGRQLSSGDNAEIILGYNYQVAGKIFPKPISLNDRIYINGKQLKVVGFFDEVGTPQDDAQIYVSNDYIDNIYPDQNNSYGWIVARVDVKNIDSVVLKIEKNLRQERDLEEGKEDFFVQSFKDMIEGYSSALNIVIGFIVLIALISVLVSAVNTANTMITSVIERTKEIGIIKSIGARNSSVFSIFLFESSFLGFVSGVVGVLIGYLLSSLGGALLKNLGYGFLQPDLNPWLFVGCILFATITGAVSGVFPAIRAAKTNPVDALRYE